MSAKDRAIEIFNQHIALASTDGKVFRKTVIGQLMAETGCTLAAASTHYNTAKKLSDPVAGLGRATPGRTARKNKPVKDVEVVPDDECFTVIELLSNEGNVTVGRCQSFILQGDASEKFDEKVVAWPAQEWIMIQGLGPNHGDNFKLGTSEKEIKHYVPQKEEATA